MDEDEGGPGIAGNQRKMAEGVTDDLRPDVIGVGIAGKVNLGEGGVREEGGLEIIQLTEAWGGVCRVPLRHFGAGEASGEGVEVVAPRAQ